MQPELCSTHVTRSRTEEDGEHTDQPAGSQSAGSATPVFDQALWRSRRTRSPQFGQGSERLRVSGMDLDRLPLVVPFQKALGGGWHPWEKYHVNTTADHRRGLTSLYLPRTSIPVGFLLCATR